MARHRIRLMTVVVAIVAIMAALTALLGLIWAGQRRLMSLSESRRFGGIGRAQRRRGGDVRSRRRHHLARVVSPERTNRAIAPVFSSSTGTPATAPTARPRCGLRSRGLSVLLFDTAALAEKDGAPTESGLTLDARAARDHILTRREPPTSLVYFGGSLRIRRRDDAGGGTLPVR